MWVGDDHAVPRPSFLQPVDVPGQDPDADLRVFVGLNTDWIAYLIGALVQLFPPTAWTTTDPDALVLVQCRVAQLLYLLAEAPTSIEFPIVFQILGDGTLQYSLDDGFSWADTGFRFGPPSGGFPWPITPNAISNGAPPPFVWNGGAGLPVYTTPGGTPLQGTPGQPIYTQDHPNTPLRGA